GPGEHARSGAGWHAPRDSYTRATRGTGRFRLAAGPPCLSWRDPRWKSDLGSASRAALYDLDDGYPVGTGIRRRPCIFGDLLIAASTLTVALILAGDHSWPRRRFWLVASLTIVFGIGYTAFSESLNVFALASWTYSDWMPFV